MQEGRSNNPVLLMQGNREANRVSGHHDRCLGQDGQIIGGGDMRRNTKVDLNQVEIVQALRRVGATVQHLHVVGWGCPDLLIGYHGVNYLMELKSEDGQLGLGQDTWHRNWRGQVVTVRSVDDALSAIGL